MRYLVSGCGVSAMCDSPERVLYWYKEFVERGGTPDIKVLGENA